MYKQGGRDGGRRRATAGARCREELPGTDFAPIEATFFSDTEVVATNTGILSLFLSNPSPVESLHKGRVS